MLARLIAERYRIWVVFGIAKTSAERSIMPFYNFEVRTPSHVMLTEGAELPDVTSARIEAAKRIGTLLHEHAGRLWIDQDWQMDITDETGLILYIIQVSALRSAATMSETEAKTSQ